MLKQWTYSDFGIKYVYIPNRPDIILTNDGVLMNINHLKRMTKDEYKSLAINNAVYDYDLSKNSGRLIKKPNIDNKENKKMATLDKAESIKKDKLPIKEIKKDNKIINTDKPKRKYKKRRSKKHFNFVEDFGRYLMLLVSIGTGVLSIFYTTKYLQSLKNPFTIAFLLSSTMYIFGLFGINFSHTFKARGNKGLSRLFLFCSLLTISASILSSADVNMTHYLESVAENEKKIESNKGQTLKVQILQDELNSNNKQIEVLQKDIETQSKVYVRSWSNELNDFVTIEGKITEVASNQITTDKQQIEDLSNRNKEINIQLMELADNGVSFTEKEEKHSLSLSDVLGNLFHIKSEYIHLIILLFYSCFIDIVSVLGMTAFYRLKEEKK